MLMAAMRYGACQRYREDGKPFNLLMPSLINGNTVQLETSKTDTAGMTRKTHKNAGLRHRLGFMPHRCPHLLLNRKQSIFSTQ